MTPQSAQRHLDRVLALLAGTQHGVVAWWQIAAAGVPRDALKDRLERGLLHRVHRGVYAVGHAHLSPEGRRMAAVLALGPGAVLSHRSAAEHLGLLRRSASPVIHVSVLQRSGRRRRSGIVVHHAPGAAWADHDRIPTTTWPQTLIDLAVSAPPAVLTWAIQGAERLQLLDLAELRPFLAGRPGARALRAALAGYEDAPTRSELERRFLVLCRDHGIARPLVNTYVEGYLADFTWPDVRLIVETDGEQHGGRSAMGDDRERDAVHALAGYRTLRFTWEQVVNRPAFVAGVVAKVLADRAPLSAFRGDSTPERAQG